MDKRVESKEEAMPRKLRLEGLRADLAAVEELLDEAVRNSDPVGKLQYEFRRQQITKEIREMESAPEHSASVALSCRFAVEERGSLGNGDVNVESRKKSLLAARIMGRQSDPFFP